MATERGKETEGRERKDTGVARREAAPPAAAAFANPFTFMRRFMEDVDRLFSGFGPGPMPRIDVTGPAEGREAMWVPAVEVLERNGQLIVRADVPGLSKDQVNVEIEEGTLIISGERTQEQQEERRGGFYRTERSYGAFYRAIPLPEGVDPNQAKASFKNGVLEVTMPTPRRAETKRVEVQEEGGAKTGQETGQQKAGQQAKSA